jgi:hypothetical protein
MAATWGASMKIGIAPNEDRHSPELRWFWSITTYVDPKLGITRSGHAASIEEAKAQFLANWQKCRTDSSPAPRPSI